MNNGIREIKVIQPTSGMITKETGGQISKRKNREQRILGWNDLLS